jgi:hypothetical protein
LSQVIDGARDSSGLSPLSARPIATPANTSSETTWAMISTFWNRAEISVPSTHSAVIARITSTVIGMTTGVLAGQVVQPDGSSPKRTAVSASEPITSTPVIAIAQPPIQPSHGPIARVTQENVVPQSWSARLR